MPQHESLIGEPRDILESVAHSYNAHDVVINDGMVNRVGLVDERLVIKVPKSVAAADGLATEAAALKLLEDSPPLAVAVPKLIEFSSDPVYLVSSYLPGRVIEAPDLDKLSTRSRETLGRDIGRYVLTQATEIDVLRVCQQIPSSEQSDSWDNLFESGIGNFSSKAYPSLSKVAVHLYAMWTAYQGGNIDTQFTQGDLRLGNMVTSADSRLTGVFDFGRAGFGNPSYEVSPLANIDATILTAAVDELRVGGLAINEEHIQLWDNMKDVLKLTYAVTSNVAPSFIAKALRKIPSHFSELNWSELGQLSSSSNCSHKVTKASKI